jgi:GYD domain
MSVTGCRSRLFPEVSHAEVFDRGFLQRGGSKGYHEQGGTARRAVVQKMVESLGGRLDAFYFVFGENDVHVILDLPENLTGPRSRWP